MLDDEKLKQQILNEVNDDCIPNMATSIKQKYLNKKEAKKPWYKSGWLWGTMTPILACGIVAAVVIPNINFNNNNEEVVKPLAIIGKQNQIAFGVLSASNMLNYSDSAPEIMPKMKQNISNDQFKKEIEYLNPYMLTAETMLDSSLDLNPTISKNDDPNYDYEFLMVIQNSDEEVYFYYNEIGENNIAIRNVENEDEDDDDDSDDDIEKEDDAEEQEFNIDGIFIKDDMQYFVVGEKELDTIENEYELELKIFPTKEEENKNYILIEQEIETSENEKEQSYLYSVVENGKKTFNAEIEFESDEDDDPMVDIKIHTLDIDSKYQIKKEGLAFSCEYQMTQAQGQIEILIENLKNTSNYIYKENELGYTIKLKRN